MNDRDADLLNELVTRAPQATAADLATMSPAVARSVHELRTHGAVTIIKLLHHGTVALVRFVPRDDGSPQEATVDGERYRRVAGPVAILVAPSHRA